MKNFVFSMAFLCLFFLTCCQQGTKLPENYQAEVCDELIQIDKLFFEAWDNEDLDSCMSFIAPDFINMFSAGTASNFEESRESYKSMFENYIIEGVKFDRSECFVDQNFAFEIGTFEQTLISNDGKDTIPGKARAISILKKQPDGKWKQFRLISQQ